MTVLPKYLVRPEEFSRLLVIQAEVTRAMKHGYVPDEDAQQEINERAARLVELAELLGYKDSPEKYVNDRIAAWLKTNPLPLDPARICDAVGSYAETMPLEGVRVQIGDTDSGYGYRVMTEDFQLSFVGGAGAVVLKIPDAVAEHFRQQGKRQLQADFRNLLNVSRG